MTYGTAPCQIWALLLDCHCDTAGTEGVGIAPVRSAVYSWNMPVGVNSRYCRGGIRQSARTPVDDEIMGGTEVQRRGLPIVLQAKPSTEAYRSGSRDRDPNLLEGLDGELLRLGHRHRLVAVRERLLQIRLGALGAAADGLGRVAHLSCKPWRALRQTRSL